MKSLIKSALRPFGVELRRVAAPSAPLPGSSDRPVGNIGFFLEDLKTRGFRPRGILDIGANRGDWTRLALSVFPQTAVVMVEPQNEMEATLTEVCQEFRTCRYIKAGAGREAGTLVQTIWKDLAGSSFLPEKDPEKLKSGAQRETPIVTINGILEEVPDGFVPDLVKLDVQGFELEALRGGARLFAQTEVFVIETSLFPFFRGMPITREVIQFMAERGYEIYDITESLRRSHDGALGQVDFAFVKAAGVFRKHLEW